jgi:hypothetical protein
MEDDWSCGWVVAFIKPEECSSDAPPFSTLAPVDKRPINLKKEIDYRSR